MDANIPVRIHPNIVEAMANELMIARALCSGKRTRTTMLDGRRVISDSPPLVDRAPYRFSRLGGTHVWGLRYGSTLTTRHPGCLAFALSLRTQLRVRSLRSMITT